MGQDYTPDNYGAAFESVKLALQEGECYQVNLTQRLSFELTGTAWDLFVSRCGVHPPPYASFAHQGDVQVSSWSPELFLEKRCETVQMKPMKGTAPREHPPENLRTAKTFAENLMILDMVRNDLGAVAKVASVSVPQAFSIESHRSVWQMSSTAKATFEGDSFELLRAVFPPASVTGAPKRSACSVILRLEQSPRGLYCGALGYAIRGDIRLSVAIRTAEVAGRRVSYGVGSGIVWDSDRADEYAEWQLKAEMLLKAAEPWALLETMAHDIVQQPSTLERHLARLEESCRVFEIPFERDRILQAMKDQPPREVPYGRIRLRVLPDGSPRVSTASGRSEGMPLRFTLATWPVSSRDPGLLHKTTARQVYQEHLDAAPGVDEVLLYNQLGEITEFATGAVLLRLGESWLTPPESSGCLPSVGISGTEGVRRKILTRKELEAADEIWMVNARGRWPMNWQK